MVTKRDLTLLTQRLTAFQISRALGIDIHTAQRIIGDDIDLSELDPQVLNQLNELSEKLITRD